MAASELRKLVILSLVIFSGWITFWSSFRLAASNQPQQDEARGTEEQSRVRILHRSFKQTGAELNIELEKKPKPQAETKSSGVEFMLVTGERSSACGTSQGSFTLMRSYKNKVDYCNLHGCRVWLALETWSPEFRGTWARCPILKQLMLRNPQVDWFMWMDADAIFTDLSFSIPFQDYEQRDMVVPGYSDKVYGENPDWVGLNAGVFLIRNSEWSLKFLESWMELNSEDSTGRILAEISSRPEGWGVDDQTSLVYMLRHLPAASRERIFMELRYVLHGYWELIVDTLESSSSPFVTHFCGCGFCGNQVSPRCFSSFNRAYHFADDQLLDRVGLRHLNLSSSEVVMKP